MKNYGFTKIRNTDLHVGITFNWRNNKIEEYDDEFLVKMKLEVIVEDEDAEKVAEAIKKAAYSGKIGDGKIFIYNIDQVIRIRTGEKDSDAV